MTEQRGDAGRSSSATKTGALVRTLTAPEFGLRDLAGVDGDAAIVARVDRSDAQRRLARAARRSAPLRSAQRRRRRRDRDARDHGVIVVDTRCADRRPRAPTRSPPTARAELPSVAERPRLVPTTVLETVQIAGRTHHVAITRPRAFDPHAPLSGAAQGLRRPARADGHRRARRVRDGSVVRRRRLHRRAQPTAAARRTAAARGSARCSSDLITIPLDDQVDALQRARRAPPRARPVARRRVRLVVRRLLLRDGRAAAPRRVPRRGRRRAGHRLGALRHRVHRALHEARPRTTPTATRATSALTHAAKLTRPLLVIHGITDDNVHFAHTLALIEALYVAGKRAEVITLSATHMVPDPKLNLAREQVQIDFFRAALGSVIRDPAPRRALRRRRQAGRRRHASRLGTTTTSAAAARARRGRRVRLSGPSPRSRRVRHRAVRARHSEAARAFSEAWPAADKRYLAITRGHPPEHARDRSRDPAARPARRASTRSPRSGGARRSAATRSSRRARAPAGCTRSAAT